MLANKSSQGAACAIAAYGFWGLIPIYFKSIDSAHPGEILAHRIVWSVVLLFVALALMGKLGELKSSLTTINKLKPLLLSSLLISVNWLIFIWAINNERVLETSLGYYINPLVSVFLAMVVLKEQLNRLQWAAIAIASLGVINQLISFGQAPIVALSLAFSFAGYGLVRKKISVNPFVGLAVETIILAPLALLYFLWISGQNQMAFTNISLAFDCLLILSGFITAFPLVMFAAAANRLSLTALGIFQYLAPSVSFVLAVVLYNEPFGVSQIITFSLIWGALAVFCIDGFRKNR